MHEKDTREKIRQFDKAHENQQHSYLEHVRFSLKHAIFHIFHYI